MCGWFFGCACVCVCVGGGGMRRQRSRPACPVPHTVPGPAWNTAGCGRRGRGSRRRRPLGTTGERREERRGRWCGGWWGGGGGEEVRVGQGQGQGQGPDGLTPLPHLPRGHERKGRLGEREAAGRGFRVRERRGEVWVRGIGQGDEQGSDAVRLWGSSDVGCSVPWTGGWRT